MNCVPKNRSKRIWTYGVRCAKLLFVAIAVSLIGTVAVLAQDEPEQIVDAADIQSVMNDAPEIKPGSDQPTGLDMLTLIAQGGWFMIPIGLMSMLVVTLSVERVLSLRSGKIVPRKLVEELGDLVVAPEAFSPQDAFEVCSRYHSPASRVVAAMLARTGQPLPDIQQAASETIQREADRYASPVRWLTLAAAATPLMGLLGTVWGMIVAFHESTSLTADRSRSEQLSEGIYTALVTTLAGLVVAIPAAIMAQYLENRIAKLFHRIEEIAFALAPGFIRFVGRSRLDGQGNLVPLESAAPPIGQVPPPPPSGSVGSIPKPPPVAESVLAKSSRH